MSVFPHRHDAAHFWPCSGPVPHGTHNKYRFSSFPQILALISGWGRVSYAFLRQFSFLHLDILGLVLRQLFELPHHLGRDFSVTVPQNASCSAQNLVGDVVGKKKNLISQPHPGPAYGHMASLGTWYLTSGISFTEMMSKVH